MTATVPNDVKSRFLLHKAMSGNMLTVSSQKSPEYYLKLIRYHFVNNSDNLCLQALGLSCPNLVHVASLVTMKGYAKYKRIKNDHITVPVADSRTGNHMGLIKKVRLTIKLQRSDDFTKILESEKQQVEATKDD
jgi:hypothetical protein